MKKVTEQQLMSATSLLREYITVVEAEAPASQNPRPAFAPDPRLYPAFKPGAIRDGGRPNGIPGDAKTSVAPPPKPKITPSDASGPNLDGTVGATPPLAPKPGSNDFSLPKLDTKIKYPVTPGIDTKFVPYDQNNPSAGQQKALDAAAKLKQQGSSGKPVTPNKAPIKAPAAKSPAKPDPTVMFQQQELNKRGAGLTVNGIKDQKTINALKQYNSGKLTPYVDPGSAQGQALRQQTAAPKPAIAPRPAAPRTNSVDSAMGSFAAESSYSDVPTLARITQLAGL